MVRQPTGNSRGQQTKPTALKVLHGDFKINPQRRNTREPVPSAITVEAPAYMTAPARKVWDDLSPDMIRVGVLTSWDVHVFAELCEAFIVARLARMNVIKELTGELITPPGGTTPNSVWRTALYAINSGAVKFGISPGDRVRLATPESERHDDLISGGY